MLVLKVIIGGSLEIALQNRNNPQKKTLKDSLGLTKVSLAAIVSQCRKLSCRTVSCEVLLLLLICCIHFLALQLFEGATEPLRPDDPHPQTHSPQPDFDPFLTRFRAVFFFSLFLFQHCEAWWTAIPLFSAGQIDQI